MSAVPAEGWVFSADLDEDVRSWLRVGGRHLWGGARSLGKERQQPVLFLRAGPPRARWLGSGVVLEPEERWKAFGVWVECRRVLKRPLPALPEKHGSSDRPEVAEILRAGAPAWENRALAAKIGLAGFRFTTPYLDDDEDLRVSASDWERLFRLQPGLRDLTKA